MFVACWVISSTLVQGHNTNTLEKNDPKQCFLPQLRCGRASEGRGKSAAAWSCSARGLRIIAARLGFCACPARSDLASISSRTSGKPSLGFQARANVGRDALWLFCSISPRADLRHSRLKPFWRQAEAEFSLFRIDVDQDERSDFELLQHRQRLDTREDAIARLRALDRRVLVHAKHRLDRKRLTDNPDIPSLKHDDEGERALRGTACLPKRHGDRAVRSTCTGTRVTFGDPLVGSELLRRASR